MANFKEIMAMCLDGASYSRITTVLGCSRRDVSRVKAIIAEESITAESFRLLPPGWLASRFSDGRSNRRQAYDQPDFKALAQRLKNNRHLTRNQLWMDYLAAESADGEVKYQYSQFCAGLRDYLRVNDLDGVVEHEPGQELYVDWAGDKVPIVDAATGEVGMKASLFVAVCPYSGLMFVTAKANEKMPAWLECHVQALEYVGKVPSVVVPDNAPTATYRPKKHSTYRLVLPKYQELADYYQMTIVPTRPARPKDKAAVERAVQIAYTKIMGYFDGVTFYSLDDLNEEIAIRLEDINSGLARPDGTTRRKRFDEEEAPVMRDLPATAFTDVVWKHPKVDRNWHVMCDYQYYSVPFTLVGKRLTARITPGLVTLFDGEHIVAEHVRLTGFKYRYSTDPAHGPADGDTSHNVLTRDELISWASSFGPATLTVVTMIIDRNQAATPKGLFQVRNILAKLGKKHGKTTLEPACREALNKKLVPTMTVLQRLQTTIAHEMKNGHTPHRSGCDVARTPQSTPVDITQFSANDVFIRPIEHYADDGDTGLVNDVFPYGTHTSQEGGNLQ